MVIGPTKLLGKGIFLVGRLFFRYWWIAMTLVIIIPGFISSFNEGVEQQDLKIPMRYLGTTIISSDQGIYEAVQDLEFENPKKENFIGKVGYYLDFGFYILKNLWRHLWMMMFFFIVFFKGEKFLMGNDSKSLRAFILSIFTMAGLQVLSFGIPFKGIYSLIKFVIISF